MLARLSGLFADDREALAVLEGLAKGLTPAEIESRYGVKPTTYDSTRRRMQAEDRALGPGDALMTDAMSCNDLAESACSTASRTGNLWLRPTATC